MKGILWSTGNDLISIYDTFMWYAYFLERILHDIPAGHLFLVFLSLGGRSFFAGPGGLMDEGGDEVEDVVGVDLNEEEVN